MSGVLKVQLHVIATVMEARYAYKGYPCRKKRVPHRESSREDCMPEIPKCGQSGLFKRKVVVLLKRLARSSEDLRSKFLLKQDQDFG